jgi:hypothetical protein
VLPSQRNLAKWLHGLPVLMLNATTHIGRHPPLLPQPTMAPLPQAKLEHQHAHQIRDLFGKSTMTKKKLAGLEAKVRSPTAAAKRVVDRAAGGELGSRKSNGW